MLAKTIDRSIVSNFDINLVRTRLEEQSIARVTPLAMTTVTSIFSKHLIDDRLASPWIIRIYDFDGAGPVRRVGFTS